MKRITPKDFDMPARRSISRQSERDRIDRQTRELCRVVRAAYRERKHDRPKGMAIVLAGPPGAGKTATAELIASEAGQPLYRVDLSSVVSKYISETEKNLQKVFNAAEASSAILLFDEADELFGERTAVNDANDRHANIDVTTLLKRIEVYPGIVIVITNRIANLDPAFTRRARFTVDLSLPGNEGR